MYLLDTTYIRDMVDYSFGDESGSKLPCGYMRPANISNKAFLKKYEEVKEAKPFMTLFIDNIRLYNRKCKYTAIEQVRGDWKQLKDKKLLELDGQDLLKLCASLPDMKFIIFTGFEDTPVDNCIHDKIPENVIAIYATNSPEAYGGKVKPFPYGLQRKLRPQDIRHDILASMLTEEFQPRKLLYVNHSTFTNPQRVVLNTQFSKYPWATVAQPTGDYRNYLTSIKMHKFMLCPEGNAIGCDCHRDWEVLYMRRVPVIRYSKYKEQLFKGFPVLFVDSFDEVNESLLIKNDKLYRDALNFNRNQLDISKMYQKIIHDTTNLCDKPAAPDRQTGKDIKAA